MPVGPPVKRVVDSYNGVPCTTLRPPDAPVRPGEPCGQIHEYCRGHIRGRGRDIPPPRLGDPCTGHAVSGATVCQAHGGTRVAVKNAARRRLVLEAEEGGELGELLARTRLAVSGRQQVEAIDAARDEVAAMVEALAQEIAKLPLESTAVVRTVDGKTEVTVLEAGLTGPNDKGNLVSHPLVALYGEWMDRMVRTEKVAHDIDTEERRVAIEESQAHALVSIVKGAVAALGFDVDDAEVLAAVAGQLRNADALETSGRATPPWQQPALEADTLDGDDDDDGLSGALVPATPPDDDEPDGLAGTLFDGAS